MMRYELIHVIYRNRHDGFVDDITLDELILSRKIIQFYRPSQEKWINLDTDPIRIQEKQSSSFGRRVSDNELPNDLYLQGLCKSLGIDAEQLDKKPRGLLSRLVMHKKKPIAPQKALTAEEWFERGFKSLHIEHDDEGALRAFAKCIQLDPSNQRTYFNRGLTYEKVGNIHQAIDDYSKAIELAPEDAKVYYFCGLARKRLGMDEVAMEDLEKAAQLGYRPAINYIKYRRIYF